MDKKFVIALIAAVVVVGGAAYYLGQQQGLSLGQKKGYDEGVNATEEKYKGILSKAETAVVDPVENLPSANPFEEVKANPFADIKTNPFK